MAEEKDEPNLNENKKSLSIILGAVVLLVAAFFAWKYLYMKPLVEKAQNEIFYAEKWFEKDSINLAINGHGDTLGFAKVVDQYSNTPSGNLAHYYLGICYRSKGNYKEAIKQFQDYDGNDQLVSSIATGSIGDCYLELGNAEDAGTYYMKAASQNHNNFTSPIYLKKAGMVYEQQKNYTEALKAYEKIKTEYFESPESRDIDKFIARAKTKGSIN
jgi:tetratricopeptide (TPR) repeat protein